ncbi:MAG: SOS response-associated peptidase [Pseudomonadota bacterium]
MDDEPFAVLMPRVMPECAREALNGMYGWHKSVTPNPVDAYSAIWDALKREAEAKRREGPVCNLYSNTMPPDAMVRLFKVKRSKIGNQPPLPAIFPRYDAPVVRLGEDGERELVTMHWGFLMPQVSKKTGKPILLKAINNARDDKLTTSSFWRQSFRQRRCLIPATSFCEAKGRKPATFYWFALTGEEERPPFAFAGIWSQFRGRYRDRELVEIDTFSMITTTPNELTRKVHPDRMPVILPPECYERWLYGDEEDGLHLLRPFPAELMCVVREDEGERADTA